MAWQWQSMKVPTGSNRGPAAVRGRLEAAGDGWQRRVAAGGQPVLNQSLPTSHFPAEIPVPLPSGWPLSSRISATSRCFDTPADTQTHKRSPTPAHELRRRLSAARDAT